MNNGVEDTANWVKSVGKTLKHVTGRIVNSIQQFNSSTTFVRTARAEFVV